jgi:hypothetical protein
MKKNFIDMTGWKMWEHGVPDSRLTVIERAENDSSGAACWLVECSCEKHTRFITRGRHLRGGQTKSCGCYHSEISRELGKSKAIDLTGRVFTYLTVLERVENRVTSGGNPQVCWRCRCKCGAIVVVTSGQLLSGGTKSCGCYSAEIAGKRLSEFNKRYNDYDLSNEYGIGYTSKGESFWFDLEDYERIKDYCWHYHHTGYLVAKDGNRHILFHKLIMDDLENHFDIDHIEHDPAPANRYDNRKCNLRVVTRSQNNMNRHIGKNNTSGVKGVCWHSRDNEWRAQIGYRGKNIHLGGFQNFEDAVAARKQAEEKYFKEFNLKEND